jgi:phenylpropionate dioxygenase-like ring-hydroxylating dioxygenase large terminal subunit
MVQTSTKPQVYPTMPGRDYHAEEVFDLEREKIFHDGWVCVGREELLANPGDFVTREVMGESILIVRTKDGELKGFYNVCRHRGTRLCDDDGQMKSVIKCPYHSWTYSFDGELLGTPNVHPDEGFDKTQYPLWNVALDVWEGFLFVHLGENPPSLLDWLRNDPDDPLQFERYRVKDLRIGKRITYDVQANWKIVMENYNECLHCPSVHPELVSIVPIYRKGEVIEKEGWVGNTLIEGGTSFTFDGTSKLPPLPGIDDIDRHAYYGFALFPTLLINYHSDCVMTYQLWPVSPDRTIVVSEFLFMPETIESADFDPSEVVDFWDLVSRQDWVICERAHVGTRSKAYTSGVFPKQDGLLHEFTERYLKVRGPAPAKR